MRNHTTAAVSLALLICAGAAYPVTIEYAVTDIPDAVPGQNLWRDDYTVAGGPFLQGQFFDIYFNPLLYGTLTAGPAPGSGWDVMILQQPNPANLPPFDRGMFDAFALANNASLSGTFSVTFTFLGSGTPDSQPFQVFGADASLAESGFTTPAVADVAIPEPSTLFLFAFGALALLRGPRWRIRNTRA